MKAKKVVKNATYWKNVAMAKESETLRERQELNAARNKILAVINEANQIREDNKSILRENQNLKLQRATMQLRTGVDSQAEVVMSMKKAMEYSINTSAALLDAMGELVDRVSGRKARREGETGL